MAELREGLNDGQMMHGRYAARGHSHGRALLEKIIPRPWLCLPEVYMRSAAQTRNILFLGSSPQILPPLRQSRYGSYDSTPSRPPVLGEAPPAVSA